MAADIKYELTIDLPSQGKLQGSMKTVDLKSMTVKDEKVLQTKQGQAHKIVRLLGSCSSAGEKGILSFPFMDAVYTMIRLRNLSLGTSLYSFKSRCSQCEEVLFVSVDLDKLSISPLEDETEPFKIVLPSCGKTLELHYLRMGDQAEVERITTSRRAQGVEIDENVTSERYARMTDKINGEKALFMATTAFYDSLKLSDMNYLRTELAKHDFGVDLSTPVTCNRCGGTDQYVVRFETGFFRPPREQ